MTEEPLIIRISDVRKAGHCVRGAGSWFKRHDLDFRDFIKNGIPADKFIATGDALAQRVVDHKLAREKEKAE